MKTWTRVGILTLSACALVCRVRYVEPDGGAGLLHLARPGDSASRAAERLGAAGADVHLEGDTLTATRGPYMLHATLDADGRVSADPLVLDFTGDMTGEGRAPWWWPVWWVLAPPRQEPSRRHTVDGAGAAP